MNVVVGIDGSDQSIEALRFAAEEAKLRHAELRVVYGLTFPFPDYWANPAVVDPEPFMERARQWMDHALVAVGDELEGLEVERILEPGTAMTVLLDHATADDLLVVGSRGRGGFRGLLLGSVSQQVVLHAPCPVVVVRCGPAADED